MNELFSERKKLFEDVISFNKTNRIPTIMNGCITWMAFDSELKPKLSQMCYDWDTATKVVYECQERYRFDAAHTFTARNVSTIGDILGYTMHKIDDEKGSIEFQGKFMLQPEEYDEYLKDQMIFTYKKMLPRLFGQLTYGQLEDCVKENLKAQKFTKEINEGAKILYGMPKVTDSFFRHCTHTLMYVYRGMEGLSTDMRRCPEKIEELNLQYEPGTLSGVQNAIDNPSGDAFTTFEASMVAHCIMNPKQFARFYWPTLKKCIDLCVDNNKKMLFFVENELLRFKDYFADIPRGLAMVIPEMDSVFEIRKALPNLAIAGGMPLTLLSKGTVQECVDYAKKLIDTMGEGYAMSTDKILTYKVDFRRETLLAVQNYCLNTKLN